MDQNPNIKKDEKNKEEEKDSSQNEMIIKKPLRPAKYRNYTPDEKRSFIVQAKSPNQTPEGTAKLKEIGPTNIQRWSKQFENSAVDFGKDMRQEKSGRKVKYPQLDEHIKSWFTKLRTARASVSGVMVFAEAQNYVNLHKLQYIKLSKGRHHKILKRFNIVKRKVTKIAQKSSALFQLQIKKFISVMIEHW